MAFKLKGMGFGDGTGSPFKFLGLFGGGGGEEEPQPTMEPKNDGAELTSLLQQLNKKKQ